MPGDARARFRAAVTAAAVPPTLEAAWNGPVPDPAAGQVWRARIAELTELVLLIAVDAHTVMAAPVSIDAEYADEQAVTVPADESPLGVATTVWLGLAHTVPMRTLDRCAGRLTPPAAEVTSTIRGIGQPGAAVVSAAQPVAEYRARLADCIEKLSNVSSEIPGTGELPALLTTAGLKPSRLVELGLDTPRALSVARGTAAVNENEAEVLARELDRSLDDVLNANPAPPTDLTTWLDRPQRRRQLEGLAAQRGIDAEEARVHAAYDVWALAAREPGGGVDWNARLDRYFDLVLDD